MSYQSGQKLPQRPDSRIHVTFDENTVVVSFHGEGRGGPQEMFSAAEWDIIVANFKKGVYDRPSRE